MRKCIKQMGFVGLVILSILLMSVPLISFAKTIKTEFYKFDAGSGWNEKEQQIISKITSHLDNVWRTVNDLFQQELYPKLKLGITKKGLASKALRKEKKVLLNAVHIKNQNLEDCLNRIAHETAHIALYKISKGKLTNWDNKFIDEGIALYTGYLYVEELEQLNALSQKIAKEDYLSGKASLDYLRDWEKNVRAKQIQFIKKWKKENPGKIPALNDFIKGGFRSYFTSYSFIHTFKSKYGFSQLLEFVREIGSGNSQPEAFQKVTGQSIDDFVKDWHSSLT